MIEPSELTEADRAYMAALIDRGGLIYVHKNKRANGGTTYVLTLDFHGIPEAVSAWIESRFEGVSLTLRGTRATFVTFRATAVLANVFSHLKVESKKRQAKAAFKLNEMRPSQGRKWTASELELRAHRAEQVYVAGQPPIRKVKLASPSFVVQKLSGGG